MKGQWEVLQDQDSYPRVLFPQETQNHLGSETTLVYPGSERGKPGGVGKSWKSRGKRTVVGIAKLTRAYPRLSA